VSDYESTQKRRNLIVGVFVFLGVCSLGGMIFQFGDLPIIVGKWKSYRVEVQFPTATGVQKNTPVRFCGYPVGKVTEVRPPEILKDPETGLSYHQAVVILSIENEYSNIPKNVEIKLMTRGLGSSYIEIKPPALDPDKPNKGVLTAGSLVQGSTGVSSEFFPEESQKKLEELVDGLSILVNNANEILGDRENKENLKLILTNLKEATAQATMTMEEIQEFAVVGRTAVKDADKKMGRITVAMVDAGEELSKTTVELRLILEKLNNGQGSAARLINDGRLYENLLENTHQLQVLLDEMKLFFEKSREKGLGIKLK
jgi:phospholipid/cholesterol/gamma-HCH transport system substrate-binding protein